MASTIDAGCTPEATSSAAMNWLAPAKTNTDMPVVAPKPMPAVRAPMPNATAMGR